MENRCFARWAVSAASPRSPRRATGATSLPFKAFAVSEVISELSVKTPFRQCRIASFGADLREEHGAGEVNRPALLKAFRAYLDANGLEADWESVSRAENAMLVNALSMMAPYGAAEKQALLEAPDLKTRAETLIAITEMALARDQDDFGTSLQ